MPIGNIKEDGQFFSITLVLENAVDFSENRGTDNLYKNPKLAKRIKPHQLGQKDKSKPLALPSNALELAKANISWLPASATYLYEVVL